MHRYLQILPNIHPKKKSLLAKYGEKALNDVLVPSAMNAGKAYLDKVIKKKFSTPEPTIEALLKKYGDISEAEYERRKRAAAVKGWEDNIRGKKSNKGKGDN